MNCPHCGREHGTRFAPNCPGPALKTGQYSHLVKAGVVTGEVQALAAARAELRSELGDVGVVKAALADSFVELDAVRSYLGQRLAEEGPLTTKGRQRALLSAYLATVDRQVRLAQVLGTDRRGGVSFADRLASAIATKAAEGSTS